MVVGCNLTHVRLTIVASSPLNDLYSLIDHLLDSATLRDILREYPTQGISSVCSQTVGCVCNKSCVM
ncbi:hypothetical protein E2C01_004845 [Portunus trituberculatus]|uniref:Uncharacterized protein n=1 Tax=Portunus trituberculatus TaxID=210409 RepID=A0A5B7CQR5_PORTR|nr:hypothetical protein [Portunus trituberculatus]